MISTPVSALLTGQPALAVLRRLLEARGVQALDLAAHVQGDAGQPEAAVLLVRTERDVGLHVERLGVPPAWAMAADSCMAKQAECAAAMSSSGLVVPPASSAARLGKDTS